jgi:diguanylate cyclase (GGDEF)-like protein
MDFNFPGLPISVALAAVAVIGYLIGRTQRSHQRGESSDSTRRELKRARAIIQDLERIAQSIRRDLAQHHTSLVKFKLRVNELGQNPDTANWKLLSSEAERLLKPTHDLATQLALAYDGIRQQNSRLMIFSGQRCDPLTGLCNRQALDETLEHYLAMHRRYGMVFSLVVFDLDEFQQVNEDHGHEHGDRVLKKVASLIDENARETDLVARLGGEEFIALLPCTELAGAGIFAERIRVTIEQRTGVTVSGGAATAVPSDDVKILLTRADTALYAAKAAGRNRVFCHTGQNVLECTTEELDSAIFASAEDVR